MVVTSISPEEKERILAERKIWYNQTYILLEIVKNLHHRELCFLPYVKGEKEHSKRYLLAFDLAYLKKHFERFVFLESLINMYHSCSVLKDVPVFLYNLKERRKTEEYKEFNENYKNYVVSYDFFIDIDGKDDFKLAYQEAKEIKKLLDKYFLPYHFLTSSFSGFHFIIDSSYMPDYPINKLLETINEIIYNIKGIYDFQTIDTSIGDMKRVRKAEYSYVCDGSIALPLDDKMFENFKPEMISMKNVMSKIFIKNRGNLTRNLKLGEETLKKNVLKFFKDFE